MIDCLLRLIIHKIKPSTFLKTLMLLRYPGSKNSFRKELDKYLPNDVTYVASPFFGGGAYEFHLASTRGIRVAGADLDNTLVNFWNVVRARERADEMADAVERLGMGMDKSTFHAMRTELMGLDMIENNLHAAATYFVLNRTSYNGIMRYYAPNAGRFTPNCISRLREFAWPDGMDRLETCDVFDFLQKHQDAFWFLDPPYYAVKSGLYGLNADNHIFDHARLANFLQSQPPTCQWMMTYDDHPHLREMYSFATIHTINVHYASRHTNKQEIIITNNPPRQLSTK